MMIKCPNPLCGYDNEIGLSKCQLCGSSLPQVNISSAINTVESPNKKPHPTSLITLTGKVKVISTDQEYPSEDPAKERRLQFYIRVIDFIPHLFGSSIFIILLVVFILPSLFRDLMNNLPDLLMELINTVVLGALRSPFSLLILIGIIFYFYMTSDKKNFLDIAGIFSSVFGLFWRLINELAKAIRSIITEMLQGLKRHFQEELNILRNKSHRHPIPIRNLRILEENSQTECSIQIKGKLNTSDIQVGDSVQADGKYNNEGVFIPVSLKNLGTDVVIWSQKNEF